MFQNEISAENVVDSIVMSVTCGKGVDTVVKGEVWGGSRFGSTETFAVGTERNAYPEEILSSLTAGWHLGKDN